MSELIGGPTPERQRIDAEFDKAVQSLTGLIGYLTRQAPEDPAQKGKKAFTTPINENGARIGASAFAPLLQRIDSITISTEAPEEHVELRDNYLWVVAFNTSNELAKLYSATPENSTSIVFWAEDVDGAGNPIGPKGFVSLTIEDEGADIAPSPDATQYIKDLTHYLFSRIEPAQ